MSRWMFDHGAVVLHSGGKVEGEGAIAGWLRADLKENLVPVYLAEPPSGGVNLDKDKDYTVDPWARQVARRFGVDLQTDYTGGDEPEWVVKIRSRPARPFDPSRRD